MTSIRSKVLIFSIKRGGLLNKTITADNLDQKRRKFKRLEKFFPKPRWVHIQSIDMPTFRGEWVTAPNSRKNKITLYIHGGGFVFDGTKLYRDLIGRLAKESATSVFSLDYSLAPEHKYPVALHEALAAYQWLLNQGYQAENIAFGGDSAGGALVLSLLHKTKLKKLPMPACAFVMSPATDATLADMSLANRDKDAFIKLDTLQFFIESYFGKTPVSDPVASPLLGSLKGFPPLLMHVDSSEIMYNDTVRFAEKARKAGVHVEVHEAQGLFHVWHVFARYLPEARASIAQIGQFVKKYLT